MIILSTMVGPFVIPWLANLIFLLFHAPERVWLPRLLRWLLVCLIVAGLDSIAFRGVWSHLWTILIGDPGKPIGAIYYFVFMGLIPFTIIATNMRRHQFHKKAFAFFSPGDITNPYHLAKAMSERLDPMSQFLSDQMKLKTSLLESPCGQTRLSIQEIEFILIGDLNRILRGPSIYDANRFTDVELRPQTTELVRQHLLEKEADSQQIIKGSRSSVLEPLVEKRISNLLRHSISFCARKIVSRQLARGKERRENERLRLNRLLLEDAFPREILSVQKKDPITTRGVLELEINTLCLCAMFYFLATIAFGIKVYPYIPVGKGGASYVESPTVTLRLRSNALNVIPAYSDPLGSNVYIMIEQTPTTVFLAATNDAGGPKFWQNMYDVPNIIEVSRDTVAAIYLHQTARPNITNNPAS